MTDRLNKNNNGTKLSFLEIMSKIEPSVTAKLQGEHIGNANYTHLNLTNIEPSIFTRSSDGKRANHVNTDLFNDLIQFGPSEGILIDLNDNKSEQDDTKETAIESICEEKPSLVDLFDNINVHPSDFTEKPAVSSHVSNLLGYKTSNVIHSKRNNVPTLDKHDELTVELDKAENVDVAGGSNITFVVNPKTNVRIEAKSVVFKCNQTVVITPDKDSEGYLQICLRPDAEFTKDFSCVKVQNPENDLKLKGAKPNNACIQNICTSIEKNLVLNALDPGSAKDILRESHISMHKEKLKQKGYIVIDATEKAITKQSISNKADDPDRKACTHNKQNNRTAKVNNTATPTPSIGQNTPKYRSDLPDIKLKVLMEDCAKTRLSEHRKRILFDHFIHGGKAIP